MKKVILKYTSEPEVKNVLDPLGLRQKLQGHKKVIIKPNLIENSPPPVTTPVDIVASLIKYLRSFTDSRIIIADGSGGSSTEDSYRCLGYYRLKDEFDIELIDLNQIPTVSISNGRFLSHKCIEFPEIVQDSFLISLPVLKDHTFATVTLSLKNMFGLYPASIYGGGIKGSWKTKVHNWGIDKSIVDINLCKKPDLSLIDGRLGMVGGHLRGKPHNFGIIIAGYDPVAVDTLGAEILGHTDVAHIRMCEKSRLGSSCFERIVIT